ncbi:hypothetical protein HD806DRAFT_84003 [Xylariaceae sp. AK1471]|nr:hypothetical protein HD806DRAFT_84003 [Xylariaceae sp. AK1471]
MHTRPIFIRARPLPSFSCLFAEFLVMKDVFSIQTTIPPGPLYLSIVDSLFGVSAVGSKFRNHGNGLANPRGLGHLGIMIVIAQTVAISVAYTMNNCDVCKQRRACGDRMVVCDRRYIVFDLLIGRGR